MTGTFRSIAMGARSQTREFMIQVAKEIKARFGSDIHLYCANKQEQQFYSKHRDRAVFASINLGSLPVEHASDTDLDEQSILEAAAYFERGTGHTINRMRVSNRHFGRGYVLGGFHHPRSRYSENTTYIQVLNAYVKALQFWEREIEEKDITLFLNGTVEAAFVARMKDIPYRIMAISRIANLHFWSWTEMYESPLFKSAMENAVIDEGEEQLAKPYASSLAGRNTYKQSLSASHCAKAIIREVARYAYWRLRGYQKAKGYYLSQNVAYHFRRWDHYRKLRKLDLKTFDEVRSLKGRKLVYYPLHVEPETALHGLSPEFFFQQELIAAVSRDMPADAILVVKEAYGAIGRRPDHFYRQIADLKNVVLLDPWEWGIECAQKSDLVVTICGTAGLEASSAGVPVITFGLHNAYDLLPSVKVIQNLADLSSAIRSALDTPPDKQEAAANAKRLINGIRSVSFDMRDYNYQKVDHFSSDSVVDAVDNLVMTLALKELVGGKTL